MNPNDKAALLLTTYEKMDWATYVKLVDALVTINEQLLDRELLNHSVIFGHYNGLLALSQDQLEKSEDDLNRFVAQLSNTILTNKSKEKKPTAKEVDSQVFSDPVYKEKKKKCMEIKSKSNLLKSLVTSLLSRKDLLVQLSSNRRAEAKIQF